MEKMELKKKVVVLMLFMGILSLIRGDSNSLIKFQGEKAQSLFVDSIIVNTVDGRVHLIDKTNGKIQWSFSSGSPLISSFRSPHANKEDISFIPAIDGTLLFLRRGKSGQPSSIERTGFTAPKIVAESPFIVEEDEIVFRGRKHTDLYAVDSITGDAIYSLKDIDVDGKASDAFSDSKSAKMNPSGAKLPPFIIGRTNYIVEAHDLHSGVEKFNFTYGVVSVLSNTKLKSVALRTQQSNRNRFLVDEKGSLECINEEGMTIWSSLLKSPVATIDSPSGKEISLEVKRYPQNLITFNPSEKSLGSSYISKLPNKQKFAVHFDLPMKTSRNPLQKQLPMPFLTGEKAHVEYDPFKDVEYKVCDDLDDFGCMIQRHMKAGHKKCVDENYFKKFARETKVLASIPLSVTILLLCIMFLSSLLIVLVGYYLFKRYMKKKDPTSTKLSSDSSSLIVPQKDAEGFLVVGCLRVSETILGYGCQGTVVFAGFLGKREVAIKRMLKQFIASAEKEIQLLINSDGHSNVVRYFAKEECGEFVYLALEKCKETLADAIFRKQNQQCSVSNPNSNMNLKRRKKDTLFLHELASGVAHLHQLRILHRDLKPHNILLTGESRSQTEESEKMTPKISDMGLGKQLNGSSINSFGSSSHLFASKQDSDSASSSAAKAPGSVGWQAPEILKFKCQANSTPSNSSDGATTNQNITSSEEIELAKARRSGAVDVFSLGCIFYHVLVPGAHPFGDWFERERNILLNVYDLSNVLNPCALSLIRGMIHSDPHERLTMEEVLDHPFFWNETKSLSLLMDVSDRLQMEDRNSELVVAIEKDASKVIRTSWENHIDRLLLSETEQFRKYNFTSVRDLLRLIRNKRHHYHDSDTQIRTIVGALPVGFCFYFLSRFPMLLMYCFRFAARHLAHEKNFHQYLGSATTRYKRKSMKTAQIPLTSSPVAARSSKSNRNSSYSIATKKKPKNKSPSNNTHKIAVPKCWFVTPSEWVNYSSPLSSRRSIKTVTPPDEKYHTTKCKNWIDSRGTECKFGSKCSFAHDYVELRIPASRSDLPWIDDEGCVVDLLSIGKQNCTFSSKLTKERFKTKPCRFFMSSLGCQNENNCRYLHPGVDEIPN